jgi:two-component system chemotaxis response regulator CheB
MVVEDSPTARELLGGILESDPDIKVVGEASNGMEAIELAARLRPDLITMDIHMPLLDGYEATKRIMDQTPTPILIVSSSSSGQEFRSSMEAIKAGALMVVSKPDNPLGERFEGRRTELLAMVKAMAEVKVVRRWNREHHVSIPTVTRRFPAGPKPRLIAIAASTGGPAAVQRILSSLPQNFPVPIVVVQHIAAGFVPGLADWLSSTCRLAVKVAAAGDVLRPGHVYLAPDGRHLGVIAEGMVALSDLPQVDGFRPSGTYLFESAARAYGTALTAVILTGMGSDGVEGLKAVKAAGGRVLAQDEASSVVYGMPREAVIAGVTDMVAGLEELAQCLIQLTAGEKP